MPAPRNGLAALLFVVVAWPVLAQQQPQDSVRPNYVLGPNDQILIRAPEAPEIDHKPVRIDGDGNIDLPLVRRIHAAGMTLEELEAELAGRLREYIREPRVFVSIVQFRAAPVFFVGLFAHPGVYPLQGGHSLEDMLGTAGPMQVNAASYITITRHEEYGLIPLPGAVFNAEKKVSSVEIKLESLGQQINPADNILLQPYDIISVGREFRLPGDLVK